MDEKEMINKEQETINEEKDYTRLIAAQIESKRRIKIKSINNTLHEENKKKIIYSIATATCFVGLMVATHFSGVDSKDAIATEIRGLQQFFANQPQEALVSVKDYLSTITLPMWGGIIALAGSLSAYIKHKKKYDKANEEFYDVTDNEPVDFQDVVERQARTK